MIVKLNKDTVKYAEQFINTRELDVTIEKLNIFIANENNHAVMKVINEKVVGLVWGYTLERMDTEPMMFIYSVDVIEEYRRKGIAKELVKSFIDYAKENGYSKTFLLTEESNFAANKLYQSLNGELITNNNLYMYK